MTEKQYIILGLLEDNKTYLIDVDEFPLGSLDAQMAQENFQKLLKDAQQLGRIIKLVKRDFENKSIHLETLYDFSKKPTRSRKKL